MKLGNTPGPLAVLRGHDDSVISLNYSQSRHLYSGAANGMLLRWNLASLRPDVVHRAHEKSIISVDDMGSSNIATSSRDGTIKIWDSDTISQPVAVLKFGVDHFCNSCTAEIDGTKVLVTPGIEQAQIFVWDLRTPQLPVQVFRPNEQVGMVTSLCSVKGESTGSTENIPSPGDILFAGYEDGSLHKFDMRFSNQICSQKVHSEPVFALHAHRSSKGISVVTGGGDSILNRSILRNNFLASTDAVHLKHPGTSCVRYRSDGRIVVSAHWDHSVRIYDQKRMKPLAVLKHHRDSVYAVEFLHKDAIISTSASEVANIDQAVTDNYLTKPHTDAADEEITSIRGCFATASKDHTIALWNVFADSFVENST